MFKSLQTKMLLLLVILLVGIGKAWASDETSQIDFSKGKFASSSITWVLSDVLTLKQTAGGGTNVNSSYISSPRVYQKNILAFVASDYYRIKKIEITYDGSYYGNSLVAGTTMQTSTSVTANTTDLNSTWSSNVSGTHVVSTISDEGESAIYIQNTCSSVNTQLRPTAISITYRNIYENVESHTATFLVNGNEYATVEVSEGREITFPSNPANIGGKAFVGWTTETIAGKATEAPDFVTSATMGTEDVSFYAVYAQQEENTVIGTKTLTFSNTDFTNNLSGSYSTKTIEKTVDGIKYSIEVNACQQNNMCQMRDNATLSYIWVKQLSGKIVNVSTTRCTNASGAAYTGTIHIKSSKTRGNSDTNDITKEELTGANSFSIDIPGENYTFYLLTSAGLRISDLSVKFEQNETVTTYSNYCTSVTESLEIGSLGYATFSADVPVNFAGSGVTAYTVKYANGSAQLTAVEQVPAGAGVIVEGTAKDYEIPVLAEATALENNDLLVSDGTMTGGDNIFCLADGNNGVGFYRVASTVTIPAGKAYLNVANNGSRQFIGFNTETTDIDIVTIGRTKTEGIFNLNGQRVAQPAKGLYIVNGKKVMVK